ncbi:MAG: hypothetical protein ABI241_00610 [Bacteroidia bacterium]
MGNLQNAQEWAKDQLQQGKLTVAEANVKIVQIAGIKVITCRLPRELRKAYNDAVKAGTLGKVAKKGLKPEIYHHINARWRALEEQDRIERGILERNHKFFA